jgi:hypothetical protein
MERLFHAWLNPGPAVPLAELPNWRELATKMDAARNGIWPVLNAALAGKKVRTTLHHGDFAPWNIRAVNAQNLQVFDWERGQLQGIPGWDWFHFVVQTAILARRHSAERAAAEVEQLLESDRFKKYAAEAGISDFVRPLLLAYMLHQKQVVQPLEGGEATEELFELLCDRWAMIPPPAAAGAPASSPAPGLWAGARLQLQTAGARFRNLFWEPSLTARTPPTMRAQLARHWPVILPGFLLLGGVTTAHYFTSVHLLFLPFYLVPCALLAWKVGRRWGMLIATVAATAGPLVASAKDAGAYKTYVVVWNVFMRFLTLQMCVLFVEQIHRQKISGCRAVPDHATGKFTGNWAVVLACGLLFVCVMALDHVTDRRMIFLPLYILPGMILTLVLNLRWGVAGALVGMTAASLEEYAANPDYGLAVVFGWNFIMRFAIAVLVILLLDHVRKGNVLFSGSRVRHHSAGKPRRAPPADA